MSDLDGFVLQKDEVVLKRKQVLWLLNVARRAGEQYVGWGWEKLEEIEACLKSK